MAVGLAIAEIALSAMQMASSFAAGQASASAQKKQLQLQKKQWQLDIQNAYDESRKVLGELKGAYKNAGYNIAQTQAKIAGIDYWLENYQDYYDYEMAQAQIGIDQQRAEIGGMFSSSIGTLRQLQEGLASQQVISAARGQSGATARLLAEYNRQEIINFAGADQTLDAEGGEYGRRYGIQQDALGLAIMAQNQRQKDLDVEKQNKQNDRMIQEIALADYQESQQDYLLSIGETLGKVVGLGYDSGQNYDDLSRLVDQYRDYIDVSDSDYETLKKELLQEYTPLDYRVTTYNYTYDKSDENSNLTGQGTQVWVKNKETDLWEAATGEQMKQLKKLYGKNYQKDYLAANADNILDFGWDKVDINQDTIQKKLEKAGSRPR